MEKTNMVTKVTNSNTGGNWFMKPVLSIAATAFATVALVGCSHGNAAPIAAGSNNNAAAGDTAGDSTAPVAAAGGDERKKQVCDQLIQTISTYQNEINEFGLEKYLSPEYFNDHTGPDELDTIPGGLASYHDAEASEIARAAKPDPHSKAIHRRVKEYCGPYFDELVKEDIDHDEHSSIRPFTPDWSL